MLITIYFVLFRLLGKSNVTTLLGSPNVTYSSNLTLSRLESNDKLTSSFPHVVAVKLSRDQRVLQRESGERSTSKSSESEEEPVRFKDDGKKSGFERGAKELQRNNSYSRRDRSEDRMEVKRKESMQTGYARRSSGRHERRSRSRSQKRLNRKRSHSVADRSSSREQRGRRSRSTEGGSKTESKDKKNISEVCHCLFL